MTEKDKKLKTNQMMKVEIPKFGIIEIGHKTEMGNVAQIIEMGNQRRELKGLRTLKQDEILRRQELWQFIIARNTLHFNSTVTVELINNQSNGLFRNNELLEFMTESENKLVLMSNFTELENYVNPYNSVDYSQLMKKFPHLIKSKRGRYGGTWAELYILLKIASMLDKDLEVAIYDVFIKSQILQYRDDGGESFKKLNIVIEKYIPSPTGNSQGRFIQIAKMLRQKLEITSTKGYNEIEHNSNIQKQRDRIEQNLIFALQSKFITSYEKLKDVIESIDIYKY